MALDHAIVMGGGIAGLLAAAGLSESFEKVTIVDRDELVVDGPKALEARRGVPHGRAVHRLLALGAERMESLLPGLREELIAVGCVPRDELAGTAHWEGGAWRARVRSDLGLLGLSRPVLEGVIRRRVLALPAVAALQGAVSGLILSEDGGTVLGIESRGLPDGRLLGDLVVDAAGRSSRAAGWIEKLGAERPAAQDTRVHVGYTCFTVRLREDGLPDGVEAVSVPASAQIPYSVDLEPVGEGTHMVSVAGTGRRYPPEDVEGIRELVAQLPTPLIATALQGADVVQDPVASKTAGAHRLLWEGTEEGPEGLVHVGDAVAAFTPLYGQGMTMAAVGASVLRETVQEAGGRIEGVSSAFQQRLAPRLDTAWSGCVARDAALDGTELEGMDAPAPHDPAEVAALIALQVVDPAIALAADHAEQWMNPEPLRAAGLEQKVSAWIAEGRGVDAASTNPEQVPGVVEVG